VANRLRGAFLDLSLNLSGGCGFVDKDAELIVVHEKAACRTLTIGVERDRLDGEVTDVSADHYANETE
jgi:hypothetical protein